MRHSAAGIARLSHVVGLGDEDAAAAELAPKRAIVAANQKLVRRAPGHHAVRNEPGGRLRHEALALQDHGRVRVGLNPDPGLQPHEGPVVIAHPLAGGQPTVDAGVGGLDFRSLAGQRLAIMGRLARGFLEDRIARPG